MNLEKLLSPTQFVAATQVDVPVCILAGAGSGKTRVVTHRIAHLIENRGERPWSILAVTFTNKAAGEMRHRVDRLVPGHGRDVQIGTFHGIAARLLRRYGRAVGVPPSFVIYDADDAQRLLKRICTVELNYAKDAVRPIMGYIDGWQSEGLLPSQVPDVHWSPFEQKAREAYARYHERLLTMNAVEFGGLLLKLRELLETPAGSEVRHRVHHLMVDEYQDTNQVQADIVLSLAKSARTVAVVGDDDQAIYGWRGASADNLKQFLERMPGSVLVKLEDNYRSTKRILNVANGIIGHNEARLGKTLRATGEEGRPVRLVQCQNDIDEARRVVEGVQRFVSTGRSPEDIAILYRTNALSRPFEDELRRQGLPYRIVGGVRFYDRKEIKDVLATLRCALNPQSDVDTTRMLAAVPRGVGEASLEKLQLVAQAQHRSLLEVMGDDAALASGGVPAKARKACATLAASMAELGALIAEDSVDAKGAVALAIERSGVADRLEAEATVEAEGRLENLQELLNAAAQFVVDQQAAAQPAGALAFLETASLLGSVESEDGDAHGERVTLMTLHAAKGLEYAAVFLVGLEEHGFPHTRAITEDAPESELEEERRLAYVGITRARERLTLTWALRRMVQGAPRPRTPSRFLGELPPESLEGDLPPRARRRGAYVFDGGGVRGGERDWSQDGPTLEYDAAATRARRSSLTGSVLQRRGLRGPAVEPIYSPDDACTTPGSDDRVSPPSIPPSSSSVLTEGARVEHASFGAGTVIGVRGIGSRQAAVVRFDEARAPRVILAAHLEVSSEHDLEPRLVYDDPGH
ncbi:MAG: ATP-dependent helicase [Myxococcota bacterium]